MEESMYVQLARKSIEEYILNNRTAKISGPIPDEFNRKAGVFVSLHKKGMLRGCIGTFAPMTENIAAEIIRNAVEAAVRDPRFQPLRQDELKDLEISVDILSDPEPVNSKDELDAKTYGVIVKSKMRRGLLLPDLEGVDTPDQQIEICRRKAGILPDEPVELFRFKVQRHH